jgi:predicted transcriptional regulator
MNALRKFSSQAEAEILEAMQELAAREGRQFQAVLGEAMREYLNRKRQQTPRRNVLEAFHDSLKERDDLYRSLAK